jgi:hypothetical protein
METRQTTGHEGTVEDRPADTPRRFSRRALILMGAGGAVAVGAAALGAYEWTRPSSGGPTPPFASRPDLDPPPVTTLVPSMGDSSGLVFVAPSAGASQYGPMLVDDRGELVWFHPLPRSTGADPYAATNFQSQVYQGAPVLTWWQGSVILTGGYGKGECVLMDSSYREITKVRTGRGLDTDLHEFVLTPSGTALLTAYRMEEADLRSVGGPARGPLLNSLFQEVDVATGAVLFEWDARQHVELTESYLAWSPSAGLFDFFHINSIDVDDDGNYLICSRHTWTVYKIDRATGEVIWRLNGKKSDFQIESDAQFSFQHHARHQPGSRISLFDDGGGPPDIDARSRGMVLQLDPAARSATLVHEYLPDPAYLSTSQGGVQVLPNGNVFVGWGSEPYWSEYTPDGRLLFDARLPDGAVSYRAFRFPWTGRPAERPAAAAEPTEQGTVVVSMSWNGATQVARWTIRSGGPSGPLRTVGRARANGFETRMDVVPGPDDTHVQVQALDTSGAVLAESARVAI